MVMVQVLVLHRLGDKEGAVDGSCVCVVAGAVMLLLLLLLLLLLPHPQHTHTITGLLRLPRATPPVPLRSQQNTRS